MLLKQKTNKLFYSKWPYKISCFVQGAHLIRIHGNGGLEYPDNIRSRHYDTSNVIEFIKKFKELLQDSSVKRRIDHNHIDFYVLTEDKFQSLQIKLKKYIVGITEPDSVEQLQTLLENKKYTLCDKLPHKKYRYKVTFKDMSPKIRNDLINWAEKYNNDDIYVPKSTKNHFKCVKHHYGAHYFYVKDSKMITLISLAAGGYIRRTDEYVIRNSINTENNQESLCQL